MASSSSERRWSYDVFLSFRGSDVRNNFLGHLYTALDQIGINTYMDSEELEMGEQISSALMEAIQESQIAIVIFSENYASSTWCLEELAKIMECKEKRNLTVFSVFYKVEPHELRTPRKSYREAMAKHKVKFRMDSEKVIRWEKALSDAGNLFGEHFTDGFEAGLIQRIVEKISTLLDRLPLKVAKYPVGIDFQVQVLREMLNLQSTNDVLMIGLWGQGGIGKTTLAKAIYNAVFREFQGSSFLECVRENSKSHGDLVALQEKLLSEVLLRKKFTSYNMARESLIQDRLQNKKVLIIIDDVDDACQLNALAGKSQWFSNGSRIIITTRDKHLLTSHGVDQMYEVQTLMDGAAFELFRKHAFQGNHEIEINNDLIDKVLCYANGLPLALEVLGSFLCGRGEDEWKSTLQKLAEIPNRKINDVLKVSYYGLENQEKEIFLDIACFFKGQYLGHIQKVLDSCDFYTTIGVRRLIEHSLIKEEHGTLQMHDLIQQMGMDIIREECWDDPGKRSRLWLYEDVLDVLSEDKGTDAIKAIVLELPQQEEMYIDPNAFTNMRNLRLLILRNVHNTFKGPLHLPNRLKWFEWPYCTSIPEFSDGPKKLVGLDLRNTNVEVVLKKFKDFKKLKFINFSGCQSLVCMPNLDNTPDLEELDLSECNNLEHAHQSVAHHGKIQLLDLSGCSKLIYLPDMRTKNLQRLILANCSKLQRFPVNPSTTNNLRELDLRGTSIEELPASIENFVSLKEMNCRDCKKLSILPSSIYRLRNLYLLSFEGCSKLIKFPKMEEDSSDPHRKMGFPKLSHLSLRRCNLSEVEFLENPSCFPSLFDLDLSGNNFTKLPPCRHLSNLEELTVSSSHQLQEILELPGRLDYLGADCCESLSKVPFDIGQVERINLSSCQELIRNMSANDLFKPEHTFEDVIIPGGEMPEWFLPNNDGHISFMVSKDLLKKFLGLNFCVVFRVKEGKRDARIRTVDSVNGKLLESSDEYFSMGSDHVWISYHYPECKGIFGPNDWHYIQFTIIASPDLIVKKCGFRLKWRPLENDLEAFLQHNQSLNLDLLYEVWHEESQTSKWEESSSETDESQDGLTSTEEDSPSKLIRKELNMADFSFEKLRYSLIHHDYRNIRPRGEMPEEFVLVEDGTISFMASQSLYDKFLGLALCVIIGVEDEKTEVSFKIVPYINRQRRNVLSETIGSFDSDHMWFQYLKTNVLWGMLQGGIDFGEFEEDYLQFGLTLEVSGGIVRKLGYVIRCLQLEDDLKAVLEDNELVNLASLCEDSHESEDSEIGCVCLHGHLPREYLRKCHMHIEDLEANDSETD